MMNQIPLDSVYQDLSRDQANEIKWLADSVDMEFAKDARVAPSIIARGELQIFGCSSPRFVYRIYFKGESGFVNIRRLLPLKGNPHRKERDISSHSQFRDITQQEILEELQKVKQSCIADCLLPRPKRYPASSYHLLTASLSAAYGENLPGEKLLPGTPYLKNVTLGGGLCSQACCFMAATMLHEYASGVHGLAEITALAHSPRRRILSISDMNFQLMANYFSTISLAMTEQKTPHMHPAGPNAEKLEFENAIKSYLLSGMPIILPVDTGKMLGYFPPRGGKMSDAKTRNTDRSIYYQNALNVDVSKFDHTQPEDHCIVLVGCEKAPDSGQESKIFFNDPSYLPFMSAYASELLDACAYMRDGDTVASEDSARGDFWPVTPDAVKMPLMDYRPRGSFEYRCGLRFISNAYHHGTLRSSSEVPNHFLLAQLGKLATTTPLDPLRTSTNFFPNVRQGMRAKLMEVSQLLQDQIFWSNKHWVWLEITQDAIYIWDAEADPISTYYPAEYLVAKLSIYNDKIHVTWPEQFELV